MKSVIAIIVIIVFSSWATWHFADKSPTAESLAAAESFNYTVLLVPLVIRPACKNFVTQVVKFAGIKVILPPAAMLDHYKTAGDTIALRNWCLKNAPQADAAIISVDMLVHGGLIASRHGKASAADIKDTLTLLNTLHKDNPRLAVYAFNILPRLWPADNEENSSYQKELLAYAKLIDQVYTFENPRDQEKLNKLLTKIPPELIGNYQRVFAENFQLNKQLIALTQTGVIKRLVIGQDDGESFGVPNLVKRQLLHYLTQAAVPADKVLVTKGADEVAATLLADIYQRTANNKLKINIQYGDEHTPTLVMPFMATSVATSVKEKLALMNGIAVDNPAAADIVFFIYIGTDNNSSNQEKVSQRLQALLSKQYRVALVDLSEHFTANETILPVLIKNNVPINQLIAYCGWNTTSNAIGFSLAEASIFTNASKSAQDDQMMINSYYNNLTFLTMRFLEDYFYLKESIELVDRALASERTDKYNFNNRDRWANTILKADMANKALLLKNSPAYNQPFAIPLNSGSVAAKISSLTIQADYPWERSFEIDLAVKIKLAKLLQ